MGYERRAHDDLDTSGQMTRDCLACADRAELPRQRRALDPAAMSSRARCGPDLELARAAAHLATRLHLV